MADNFLVAPAHFHREEYNPMEALEANYSYDDETSPLHLSFATLSAGYRPPRFFEDFNYLEIASSQSLTTLIHAAAFPHGKFYLVDSNPIHIANLRELAAKIGLDNVVAVESTVDDILSNNLPSMDYVVSCGKLVRLNDVEEQLLAEVVRQLLKPGGLLYFSYDSLPHWAAHRGAIHLMRLAFVRANGSVEKRATAARQFLGQAIQQKLALVSSEQSQHFYKELSRLSPKDLGLRFLLPSVWQPRYFSEVVELMAGAKMTYLTAANRQRQIVVQGLPEKARETLSECTDVSTRELLIDLMLNQAERRDIFGKGSIHATATDLETFFERMQLWQMRERKDYVCEAQLKMGNLAVKENTYDKIYDGMDSGANNLLELSKESSRRPSEFLASLQGALLLENIAVGVEKAAGELSKAACIRYNGELLNWSPDKDYYLVSPFLCKGIAVSWLELHAMTALDENDPYRLCNKVFERVRKLGGQFQLNGDEVSTVESFYNKTRPIFEGFIKGRRSTLLGSGVAVSK